MGPVPEWVGGSFNPELFDKRRQRLAVAHGVERLRTK
jgi:hypothetical protein